MKKQVVESNWGKGFTSVEVTLPLPTPSAEKRSHGPWRICPLFRIPASGVRLTCTSPVVRTLEHNMGMWSGKLLPPSRRSWRSPPPPSTKKSTHTMMRTRKHLKRRASKCRAQAAIRLLEEGVIEAWQLDGGPDPE